MVLSGYNDVVFVLGVVFFIFYTEFLDESVDGL